MKCSDCDEYIYDRCMGGKIDCMLQKPVYQLLSIDYKGQEFKGKAHDNKLGRNNPTTRL
jgi:hypothetical protein